MSDAAVTCPWCGGFEPSEWHLSINHWVREREPGEYDWCEAHGMCIAMSLTASHVASYARQRDGDNLARAIARAEDVWTADRRGWIDEYRNAAEPPQHAMVGVSEEVALW